MPRQWHERHAARSPISRSTSPAAAAPPIRAVDGVSLSIAPGETLGLVGESGCGKSTVSNASVGLIPPTSGSVRVLGTELAGADARTLRAIRARAQMVFQDPVTSLNPRMTVGAAIGEPLLVRNLARGIAASDASRRTAGGSRPPPGACAALPASVQRRPTPADRHRPCAGPAAGTAGMRRAGLGTRRFGPRADPESVWSTCRRATACPRCSSAMISPWFATSAIVWP